MRAAYRFLLSLFHAGLLSKVSSVRVELYQAAEKSCWPAISRLV